jgi:hypothetical protein
MSQAKEFFLKIFSKNICSSSQCYKIFQSIVCIYMYMLFNKDVWHELHMGRYIYWFMEEKGVRDEEISLGVW